jgi:uncharacterized protein YcbX
LGALETSYDDATDCLTVQRRSSGEVLLRAALASGNANDRQRVESFFSCLPNCSASSTSNGMGTLLGEGLQHSVRLVESADGTFHFGNTPVGFKSAKNPYGHASGSVVHIVNAQTVRELSVAAGLEAASDSPRSCTEEAPLVPRCGEGPLSPSRFRPNIVLDGLPAWTEFGWIGKHVRIGSVTLRVLSRTVRCEATNVDARCGSGRAVLDMLQLMNLHFPGHGPYLGVYASVVEGGSLRVGDAVAGVVHDPLVARWTAWQSRMWVLVFVIFAVCVAVISVWAAQGTTGTRTITRNIGGSK